MYTNENEILTLHHGWNGIEKGWRIWGKASNFCETENLKIRFLTLLLEKVTLWDAKTVWRNLET
jgi:hypothetical protein